MKKVLLPVLALCTTVAVFSGCREVKPAKEPSSIAVSTMTVASSSEASQRSYVGVVEEEMAASLSFEVMGSIEKLYVNAGDRVKKGQILATLNTTSAKSSLAAAEASLAQAQDGYNRIKQLHDKKTVPDVQMVEIESKLEQARSMKEIAAKNLQNCTLYAPFTGVIGKRTSGIGETVLPGVPVMSLLQIANVKVKISVPENEIAAIGPDYKSKIKVAALGDKEFYGNRVEKGSMANALSHTYEARIALPNPSGELLPGMVCNVVVSQAQVSNDICVPTRAVQQYANGKQFVWVVGADKEYASRRDVTTSHAVGNNIVVSSGLTDGDVVITDGFQKIDEHTKIKLL